MNRRQSKRETNVPDIDIGAITFDSEEVEETMDRFDIFESFRREKGTHLWTNHFRTGAFTHDGNTLPAAGAERVTQAGNVKSKPSINRGPSK